MKTLKDLKPGSHIHLMGICGTAMASLAGLFKSMGYKVTGSESNPYPPMSTQIESMGIPIFKPYQAKNLDPKPDFVIIGNVISASNEEAKEVLRLDIPYTSLAKAMGEAIIDWRQCICVSGTHGKTTTTSLMSWIAETCGKQPGFLIGGIPKNFSKSFQLPKGDFFVIEGDEYDTAYFDKVPKFIHYRPTHAILTSIEFDHADIYKNLDEIKDAFSRLMKLIPENGTLIWHGEDQNIESIKHLCKAKNTFSYGIKTGDYQPKNLKVSEKGTSFEVYKKGSRLGDYFVQMTGDYNILNATATIAMSDVLGWDQAKLKSALESFQGVKRRQEILGEPRGVLVIEDFAHHPTAVKETLKGLKSRYPTRKIFSVFEPRSATSRRKVFQKDYAQAFSIADETLLMTAFDQSKIDEGDRFSSEELVQDLKDQGQTANAFQNVDQIVSKLKADAHKGDLIVIMSNGGFDGIYQKLMKALE